MTIDETRSTLLEGLAIPACPLPLDDNREWSPRHQRAIVRYYHESGVGGIAAGVHSTQFAIRDPEVGLFEPVLRLVSQELDSLGSSCLKIAGVCGGTDQAMGESNMALDLGYHAGLLSLSAFRDASHDEIIQHCRIVSEIIPVIGFYLQPAVGGQIFPFSFWREFAEIPNVAAIKIAPFNRYQTWDVVRAVIETGRDDIALYTGNDDNIIADLMTPFAGFVNGERKIRFIDGGLLGQWGVWTRCAVHLLKKIRIERQQPDIASRWLTENVALTDANAALFDAANNFSGCIPGIMEVLRRGGLAPGNACLDALEVLSPGQAAELDRVSSTYPHLIDDDFVADNLARWLAD